MSSKTYLAFREIQKLKCRIYKIHGDANIESQREKGLRIST